jgi:TPR repeat protein
MQIIQVLLIIIFMFSMASCTGNRNTVEVIESYKEQSIQESQRDYSTAAKNYLTEAEKGNSKAMLELGVLYAYGRGVPRNYPEALRWYRLAADKGESRAMHNIGHMYQNGLGVQQNYTEAMKWYSRRR